MAQALIYGLGYDQNQMKFAQFIERSAPAIEIPDGVTVIGRSAFYDCSKAVGTVTVPDGVWRIGQDAFNNCSGVNEINLPESINKIEGYAFSNMKALKRLVLPSKVTSLNTAIASNSGIEEFWAYGDISLIGTYVFQNCTKCRKYDFTACTKVPPLGGVTSFQGIGTEARIYVPESLYDEWVVATNWSQYADHIVHFSEKLMFRTVDGGYQVCGIGESGDKDIIIPSKYRGLPVIGIYEGAFLNNAEIKSVEIPDSVTSIENYAFYSCTGLERVTIGKGVKSIARLSFHHCANIADMYVGWGEGEVAGAPWGATNATIHYNSEV